MSPSEKIRAMLDERGIDYQMHDGGNRVCFNIDYCEQCGDYLKSIDVIGNCVIASQSYLTPEQAIAATVVVGTCKNAVMCNVTDCEYNHKCRCTCGDLEIQDQECMTYRCRYIDYDEEEE